LDGVLDLHSSPDGSTTVYASLFFLIMLYCLQRMLLNPVAREGLTRSQWLSHLFLLITFLFLFLQILILSYGIQMSSYRGEARDPTPQSFERLQT